MAKRKIIHISLVLLGISGILWAQEKLKCAIYETLAKWGKTNQ
ncbi:MAG: hypothetical protein WCC06_08920 [Candidatus Aminicenantales bacterium]